MSLINVPTGTTTRTNYIGVSPWGLAFRASERRRATVTYPARAISRRPSVCCVVLKDAWREGHRPKSESSD